MTPANKIRVLIVDDSAIVRKILSETLSAEPDITVVGTAPDPYVARDKILALKPDVLTLDIEMPRMDGLTFLKKLMQFHPMPAIIISSLTQPSCRIAIEALELGAVDVLGKPGGPYSVGELRHSLGQKIRGAARARVRKSGDPSPSVARPAAPLAGAVALCNATPRVKRDMVIAIGASTGGTEAITSVLTRLPSDSPAIVITQHIPSGFSRAFANRLNDRCAMEVREARDGDEIHAGLALVAPGDFHMLVRKGGGRRYVSVKEGPRVCYQRPSVDVMFLSVAETAGSAAIGVLLTGMGSDGAQGLLKMRQAGARTIAQDEATCVVFGMPREGIALGAAEQTLPLPVISGQILRAIGSAFPVAPASVAPSTITGLGSSS